MKGQGPRGVDKNLLAPLIGESTCINTITCNGFKTISCITSTVFCSNGASNLNGVTYKHYSACIGEVLARVEDFTFKYFKFK